MDQEIKPSLSVTARLFYIIRFHDIELAEDFARRCPATISTVTELNQFFHGLLCQYSHSTETFRSRLVACDNFDLWQVRFVEHILPALRKWRLPPMTGHAVPIYTPAPSLAGYA